VRDGIPLLNISAKYSPASYLGHGFTTEQFVIAHYAAAWDSINAKPKLAKHNPYIGARENCLVSFPWQEGDYTRAASKGKTWYVVGNPWVYVVSYERVTT
jgi:hypothetical protein